MDPVEVVRRLAEPRRSSSGVEQHGQCLRHHSLCRHLPAIMMMVIMMIKVMVMVMVMINVMVMVSHSLCMQALAYKSGWHEMFE